MKTTIRAWSVIGVALGTTVSACDLSSEGVHSEQREDLLVIRAPEAPSASRARTDIGGLGDLVLSLSPLQALEDSCDPNAPTVENCCAPGSTLISGSVNKDIVINPPKTQTSFCVFSDSGDDKVKVGAGDDFVALENDDDSAKTRDGDDIVLGGLGSDAIDGGDGDDLLLGQEDNDDLRGGSGADVILGGLGDDTARGNSGDDLIRGEKGDDALWGNQGDDQLVGGAGDDSIRGGGGNDLIDGNAGSDTIQGGDGADLIVPGPGADQVFAGDGDDTVRVLGVCELVAGKLLDGGDGADELILPTTLDDALALGVVITGFESIVENADTTSSECIACGCVVDDGQLECCSGAGTCDVELDDGALTCACSAGLLGPSCSDDAADDEYPLAVPPGCVDDDPTCWGSFDAIGKAAEIDAEIVCPEFGDSFTEGGFIPTKIYHPDGGGGVLPEGEFPLVVFNGANGADYLRYEDLFVHLAQNGVVSIVSGPVSTSEVRRAMRILCSARYMLGSWESSDQLSKDIVFAGHSRGGAAAVVATNLRRQLAEENPMSMESEYTVAAVATLAPGSNCLSTPTSPECGLAEFDLGAGLVSLAEQSTEAFFMIQGSQDTDTSGRGLLHYESASPEGSGVEQQTKASQWVFNVEHKRWGGFSVNESMLSTIQSTRALARAYVTGFLRWRVLGEVELSTYFKTSAAPPCIADPGVCGYSFAAPERFGQFREPLSGRVVVSNFESSPPFGAYTVSPANAGSVVSVSETNIPYGQNVPTMALQLDGMLGATVRFPLDGGQDPVPPQSANGFVSLRLAKRAEPADPDAANDGECFEVNPLDLVATISLTGGSTVSVPSTDYARTPAPDHWFDFYSGTAAIQTCNVNEFFVTVRVPLSDFADGGVDLSALEELSVSFDAGENGTQFTALIDSVEFIEGQSACGDGIVDPGEECDDGNLVDGDGCESDCTICIPGDIGCRCLDIALPGEEEPALPFGGSLGDGRYCGPADVALGGDVRCIPGPGDEGPGVCEPCFGIGEEPWCPCLPGDGCLNGLTCEFVCDEAVGPCEPAVPNYGSCFIPGEPDPLEGGRPEWYFDWYCSLKNEQLQCVQELGENRACQVDDGPAC